MKGTSEKLAINYSFTTATFFGETQLLVLPTYVNTWEKQGNQECREAELNPQGPEDRRILSSQAGSEPFGKFSTLPYFSSAYKSHELHRYDPKCLVMSMELLQFYYR
jgi:hypothetical protein